jgi:hypothetical protein
MSAGGDACTLAPAFLCAGRNKLFQENSSMLGFLMTENTTPIMHVQTLFSDSWQAICNVPEVAYSTMTGGERAEVRLKAAQRLNLKFLLEWSPYFASTGEDRSGVPQWASYTAMMKPLTSLPSWMAAWNRAVRKMVRLKLRDSESHEDVKGDSPLSEMFYASTHQNTMMDRAAFETWANQSGYPPSTMIWLIKQMTSIIGVCPYVLKPFPPNPE